MSEQIVDLLSVSLFVPGYSLRVAVAKVAQKRRFHRDFGSFLTPVIYNAISIGAMPPSGILGENMASSTFSGNFLSTGVMATFRRLPVSRPEWPASAGRAISGRKI